MELRKKAVRLRNPSAEICGDLVAPDMSQITILISSAGRRVELMKCFRSDAETLGVRLRIVALDAEPELSAACHFADASYRPPACLHSEFLPFVEDVVRRESVSLIVPTIDPELAAYSRNAERFTLLGATVNISAPGVVAVARDKLATAKVLGESGVAVPRTLPLEAALRNPEAWLGPVIVKPVDGSSSVGIQRLQDIREVETKGLEAGRYVVQELLQGIEYTVNMFVDSSGCAACAVPHRRIAIRGGEVSKGRTERVAALRGIADRIAAVLDGSRGAICFQAIVDARGIPAVIEINARFGGGYPLAHAAGARFSQWLLEAVLGRPCSASDDWREGLTMLRYDASVFR